MGLPFAKVFPETELALRAINEAAKSVLGVYNGDFEATEKEDKSPITLADYESHRIITSILSESGIGIVSEEGQHGITPEAKKFWLVDPLDGTKEFVDRNGEFTIMIALVENGKPTLGLISHPLAGSVYVAQRGYGAYKVDDGTKQLGVSGARSLTEATAVISRSHVSPEELEFIESLKLRGYTRLGSSLKALRICSGEAEIYFAANAKIKQWDTCASYCLVTESGGRMTDMFGGEIFYKAGAFAHDKGIVMSNGLVHDEFIKKCGRLREKQLGK